MTIRSLRGVALFAACLATTQGSAEDGQLRWDMPTAYFGYHADNAAGFADRVRGATDEGIDITVHEGSTMMRGAEIVPALKSGEIVIGERLVSGFTLGDRFFDLFALPFLVSDSMESERLYALAEGEMRDRLETQGLHLIYSVPWPSQGILSKRKIVTFDDLKGIRLRSYTVELVRIATLAGMAPNGIEATDFSVHFGQNLSDAAIVPATAVEKVALWQYVSHYLRIDTRSYRNAALTTCGDDAAERGKRLAVDGEEAALARMVSEGMTITDPSETLADHLRRAVGGPFLKDWLGENGEEGAAIIAAFRGGPPDE